MSIIYNHKCRYKVITLSMSVLLLSILPLQSQFSIVVNASSGNIGDTGGNTNQDTDYNYSGGGTTGSYFNASQSGFRFYFVDSNMNRVSNVVDILETLPSCVSAEYEYTNGASETLSNDMSNYNMYTWEMMQSMVPSLAGNLPNAPLIPTGNRSNPYEPTGDEFKQWMINGIGGTTISYLMGEFAKDNTISSMNII